MTTQTYEVPAISCAHCVATIERELKFVEGLDDVKADIESKRVTVDVKDAGVLKNVEATLVEIGYPPAK